MTSEDCATFAVGPYINCQPVPCTWYEKLTASGSRVLGRNGRPHHVRIPLFLFYMALQSYCPSRQCFYLRFKLRGSMFHCQYSRLSLSVARISPKHTEAVLPCVGSISLDSGGSLGNRAHYDAYRWASSPHGNEFKGRVPAKQSIPALR